MKIIFMLLGILLGAGACMNRENSGKAAAGQGERPLKDTVGFAHLDWQMDSVVARIGRTGSGEAVVASVDPDIAWRVAICPHDDYTYAGRHYLALLRNLKAKTVIVFGVAHKARPLNISDKIVFDTFPYWHGPYRKIKVSSCREELIAALPKGLYMVSDTLQAVEHSVESMLPFLQNFNKEVEIVSILVPAMKAEKMTEIAKPLAAAISGWMKQHRLEWGKDVALLITTDAVHYGDEDWGGKNMAPFGADSVGYGRAIDKEHFIVDSCLAGTMNRGKILRFAGITVKPEDYKEYQWTWCGRYSVPFGLMTAIELQQLTNGKPLVGKRIGYSTSIDHQPLKVDDLRMGITAKASIRHWVGYASVGYE